MRRTALIPFAIAFVLFAFGGAEAATPFASPAEPSLWNQAIGWILTQQRVFHRALTGGIGTLAANGGAAAAWTLVAASFLYGVFHAAGPGHGKAVLTTYLLTTEQTLRRGMGLAAAAAFCQGLVAVILVYGLIYAAGWLPRETSDAVRWSERMSYALVLIMGAVLLFRAAQNLYRQIQHRPDHAQHGHRHDSLHDRNHHDIGACGHSHALTPVQLAAAKDLRTSVGVVLSIGLRPCTGAVLVLIFAKVSGLALAGVGAVAAMSAGSALAVAGLALVAVNLRSWTQAIAARRGGGTAWRVAGELVGLSGGGLLAAIGLSLLTASFAAPVHPLGL